MYGFSIGLDQPFEQAVGTVTQALQGEGFGVLSTVDIQAAMKDKLGVDMPAYVILGACNPPLAHQALQADPEIGLLLPCNVVVRETGRASVSVGFVDPQTLVQLSGSDAVRAVADDAGKRLERVREALQAGRKAP